MPGSGSMPAAVVRQPAARNAAATAYEVSAVERIHALKRFLPGVGVRSLPGNLTHRSGVTRSDKPPGAPGGVHRHSIDKLVGRDFRGAARRSALGGGVGGEP